MKKIIFFLTVFILFTAAQAQSSNSDCFGGVDVVGCVTTAQAQAPNNNCFAGVDVVRCTTTDPVPPSNECNYGGVNVCVREGNLYTNDGQVTVNVNSRNPRNVIVNTAPSDIRVSASLVDRGPYRSGDFIRIRVNLNRPAYLYIYNVDARNKTTMLFPNDYDRNNYVSSGNLTFPRRTSGRGYSYQLDNYTGVERIIVIASSNPDFDLSPTVSPNNASPYASNNDIDTFGTILYRTIENATVYDNVSLKEWDTYTFTFRHQ